MNKDRSKPEKTEDKPQPKAIDIIRAADKFEPITEAFDLMIGGQILKASIHSPSLNDIRREKDEAYRMEYLKAVMKGFDKLPASTEHLPDTPEPMKNLAEEVATINARTEFFMNISMQYLYGEDGKLLFPTMAEQHEAADIIGRNPQIGGQIVAAFNRVMIKMMEVLKATKNLTGETPTNSSDAAGSPNDSTTEDPGTPSSSGT